MSFGAIFAHAIFFLLAGSLFGQAPQEQFRTCTSAVAWTPCELDFELQEAEAKLHPEPWRTVELRAEVKSPRFRTFIAEAFWTGARGLKIRFTPTEAGSWELRLTSNIARFDKQLSVIPVAASENPGFIQRANVHHWRTLGNLKPHHWHGVELWDWLREGSASLSILQAKKATHVRTLFSPQWPPDPARFAAFEKQLSTWNEAGLVVDVVLAGPQNEFTTVLRDWSTRERYLRYLLSRLAPYNVTWELVKDWETYRDPRALLKDMAAIIQKYDAYAHPRSAYPLGSTAAFALDSWMTHQLVNVAQPPVIALEHQLHRLPVVAVGTSPSRRALLESVFSGSYPGTSAEDFVSTLFAGTRYWELEPYFDVSNGRALALEGTEYLVLVDRPGIVEVEVEKHSYDVAWINVDTGERIPQKEFKAQQFIGESPVKSGNWILHLSREGRKTGMLTSYKFESRSILSQEPEVDTKRLPFNINIEDNTDIKVDRPLNFEIKITKDSRATRFMQYSITADVPTESQGLRILGTQAKGALTIPRSIATKYPAVLNLRVAGMNANGKVYLLDRVLRLVE